jgi:hydroxyacylglutathione hydrolase
MISVTRFVTGPIETNTYVVADDATKTCLIVDPSTGCEEVLRKIELDGLKAEAILLTHAHFDHIMGIPEIQERVGAIPIYIHPSEAGFLSNAQLNGSTLLGEDFTFRGGVRKLSEGKIHIGSFTLDVLHIPGHTPGGCAFVFETHCLCGDALFAGSIGRSDLPGGDGDLLIASIQNKLMALADNTIAYPGHGGRTTIGRERRSNPFLV